MKTRVFANPDVQDKVTFLKTAAETNGEFTLLEVELLPGGGNPLHYHYTYAETFTPIEGQLGVQIGQEQKLLKPQESFTIKPKVVHRFYNPGKQTVKFITELRPGSVGFENFIRIIYGLAAEGATTTKGIPKNKFKAALLTQIGDTHGPGLWQLARPGIELTAWFAKKMGFEKQLLEKYCHD